MLGVGSRRVMRGWHQPCSMVGPSSESSSGWVAMEILSPTVILFLKRFYLFIFREKGSKGEREGEKYQCKRETSIGCLSNTP